MPEISRFYGIVIQIFPEDHNPPHLHAFYGEKIGVFDIRSGKMTQGTLPKKQNALVSAWIFIHQEQLIKIWDDIKDGKKTKKIKPLR